MKPNKLQSALENTFLGFVPGVLFTIFTFAIVLQLIFSRGNFEVVKMVIWGLLLLEVTLLSSGYFLMLLIINPRYLAISRCRSLIAGVCSVLIVGILSIFTQGAGIALIFSASILAGMISSISVLKLERPVRGLK